MIGRSELVALSAAGVLLAGLVGVGASVYQLRGDAERLNGELEKLRATIASRPPLVATRAGATAGEPASKPAGAGADGSSEAFAKALADMGGRLERLESMLASLSEEVAGLERSPGGARQPAAAAADSAAQYPRSEALRARADLASRFAAESGTSAWGEASQEALVRAYRTEQATNPFFSEYGGQVSSECRETVCSLSLSLDASRLSYLSAAERAEVIERARWELLGLAGGVEGGGVVRTVVSNQSGTPTIRAMLEHGTQPPSGQGIKGAIGRQGSAPSGPVGGTK